MTTYRLYATGKSNAIREFEGENLLQNGQFVQITNDDDRNIVAAFHLEPGQYVADKSKVKDTSF